MNTEPPRITQLQFLEAYAARSSVSVAKILENFAPLRCTCGEFDCEGWAMVSRDPLLRLAHEELNKEPQDGDI